MPDQLNLFRAHFERELPFVLYRKPNQTTVVGLRQYDQELHFINKYEERGFVFAPFKGNNAVFFPQLKVSVDVISSLPIIASTQSGSNPLQSDQKLKARHVNLVSNAVSAINKGDFAKVVLSRKETIALANFDPLVAFQLLQQTYPSAFAYCFFHPKVGLWLGAFGEQLLFVNGNHFHTMSIAGTQVYDEHQLPRWTEKEREEQQIVTDFIIANLREFASQIDVSAPYDIKAGKLVHLKTDISGTFQKGVDLKEVISVLHPTPAVCGFPKQAAGKFIEENEGYDRQYYSGFLGELNCDFENENYNTDLFVNLRCVSVESQMDSNSKIANVYVGGGITGASIAENEWTETINKAQTIKNILL